VIAQQERFQFSYVVTLVEVIWGARMVPVVGGMNSLAPAFTLNLKRAAPATSLQTNLNFQLVRFQGCCK
jgi:hypothetical protein